jgi:hypothetical protein
MGFRNTVRQILSKRTSNDGLPGIGFQIGSERWDIDTAPGASPDVGTMRLSGSFYRYGAMLALDNPSGGAALEFWQKGPGGSWVPNLSIRGDDANHQYAGIRNRADSDGLYLNYPAAGPALATEGATPIDIAIGSPGGLPTRYHRFTTTTFEPTTDNVISLGTLTKRFKGLFLKGATRAFIGAPASAPTDADLNNEQVTMYLNEAGNLLTFRVRYSDGTLKTGTVALV